MGVEITLEKAPGLIECGAGCHLDPLKTDGKFSG
jgi:hypothetical protein